MCPSVGVSAVLGVWETVFCIAVKIQWPIKQSDWKTSGGQTHQQTIFWFVASLEYL